MWQGTCIQRTKVQRFVDFKGFVKEMRSFRNNIRCSTIYNTTSQYYNYVPGCISAYSAYTCVHKCTL